MSAEIGEKKKILHIIQGFGSGGVETWLLAAVKYLHEHPRLNVQFDFLIAGGLPRLFDDEIRKYGSEIFYNRYSYHSILRFRKKFRRILKEHRYAAIHDHQDFISGWHFLLGEGLLPSIKIAHLHNPLNFVRNYQVSPIRRFSFKMGRKLMGRLATKITGTSDAVMDEYGYNKGIYKRKRIVPAYCGFDTYKFMYCSGAKNNLCKELGWPDTIKIALFVGRIGLQPHDTAANQKNPDFAFAIARELVSSFPQWRFVFVGYKGETGAQFEQQTKKNKLDDYIRFLDIRKDIPAIMSASDVFVFPSLWEGLGMVAVEAQCSGLNVIMSDTVPDESVVCPELVTRKNLDEGVTAWVNTIQSVNASAHERKKYADIVHQSPFSIDNSVSRLLSMYGD